MDDLGHDGSLYIDNTNTEISHLLLNNFDETLENFNITLAGIVDDFANKLTDIASAQLAPIETDLVEFTNLIEGFNNITKDITTVKEEINTICSSFNPAECPLQDILDVLSTVDNIPQIDMANFEDLTDVIGSIKSVINTVKDDFKNAYFEQILEQTGEVRNFLNETNTQITDGVNGIKDIFGDLGINSEDVGDILDNYKTAAIVLQALGSIVVVILIILMLALFWGCMGKAGDKKTSSASSIFNVTIGIYLLLGLVFFLLAVSFFTVGALLTRFVCETIDEPESSDILELMNKPFQDELTAVYEDMGGENVNLSLTIAGIINGLQEGKPIYPLFQLNQIYDLKDLSDDWKTTYNINDYINDARQRLIDAIDGLQDYNDTISEVKSTLIEATETADELLTPIINAITAFDVPNISGVNTDDLNASVNTLKQHIETAFSKYLDETTGAYEINLQGDTSDFFSDFNEILTYFALAGKDDLLKFFDCSIDQIIGVIDSYLTYAVDTLETSLGGTAPLGLMVTGFEIALCNNILDPFNTGLEIIK